MNYKEILPNESPTLRHHNNKASLKATDLKHDFDFFNYILKLKIIARGNDFDVLYDCLDELENILCEIEFIDVTQGEVDFEDLKLFFILLDHPDFDIRVKNSICISLIILKSQDIGLYFYHHNLLEHILNRFEVENNLAMNYRMFDIIISLSSLNKSILVEILKVLPINVFDKLIEIKSVPDRFGEFLITISGYEHENVDFQIRLLEILQNLIEKKKEIMYLYIVKCIYQMIIFNSRFFDQKLLFSMNFTQFLRMMLFSNDYNIVVYTHKIIGKIIYHDFFLTENDINLLLHRYNDLLKNIVGSNINMICSYAKFLAKIIICNQDMGNQIVKTEFNHLPTMLNILEANEISFQQKINLTHLILSIISSLEYTALSHIIVELNIFDYLSFIFMSDKQNLIKIFLNFLVNLKNQFEVNGNVEFYQNFLRKIPLDEFLSLKNNSNQECIELIQIIIKFIENSK
ncbi:hypothetical protein TRFO_09820 [Tritrichomonas foetus]|uniref:Uncharacterized protein n=1 Tax=Tritrichomonas foetus TaxID=1144522 RepID=A0A1J4JBU0_9EUKA|nr:hypothetical protein TRFO_09820 [Tritrichomonas foetus]|eukprot:OHS96666.1 hypothetical protein TRFO_09820 [Tritrichomonas foetus]